MRACLPGLVLLACAAAMAREQMVADTGSPAAWDILDFDGNGRVTLEMDPNAPPPHGPKVLRVTGENMLLLAKDFRMAEGCVVALYRELDPVDHDADGIVVFHAEYPDDVEPLHNTKERLPYTWLEQDNDSGLHFRGYRAGEEEAVLAQQDGLGLVTGGWNITGWIWQKVDVRGGRVRAKFWPAQEAEPAAWHLEAPWPEGGASTRVGVRIGSGDIHLAHFAASTGDISIEAPGAWLHSPRQTVPGPANLDLKLYVNDPPAGALPLTVRVLHEDSAVFSFSGERTLLGNPAYMNITRWSERIAKRPLLTAESEPGAYTVSVHSADGRVSTQAAFHLASTAEFEARLAAAHALLEAVPNAAAASFATGLHDSAAHLLRHAQAELEERGDMEAAAQALEYALQPLRRLFREEGGAWPEALAGLRADPPAPPAGDEGRTNYFHTAMNVRVTQIDLHGMGAMVAGQTYPVRVTLEGLDTVGAPITCTLLLRSPLGARTVASHTINVAAGGPGLQTLAFSLALPRPEDAKLQPQPNILSEAHHLLLRVRHAETGAEVILDMPPGRQPDLPGQHYLLGEYTVATEWPELGALTPRHARIGEPATFRVEARNDGAPMQLTAVLSITAPGGDLVHRDAQWFIIFPGQSVVLPFDWIPHTAGTLKRSLEIFEFGRLRTRIDDILHVAPPEGVSLHVRREPTRTAEGGQPVTPVAVDAVNAALRAVRVVAGGEPAGEGAPIALCRPHFGYYDVTADFGDWRYVTRLVAQTTDVRDGVLCLNGEPFLIKGLNVHGLDGASPERTRVMMRIFRELGFNSLRGDYPPPWQMDMALEENLGYSVLAPFSVCDTRDLQARLDGPFIATAQEITRLFIERYREEAGVLFWNSANEVTGETTPFLLALYPLYQMDPAGRAVHYANLFGQDRWQGQDFMSVNYYYSAHEGPEARHPQIARSLEIAREHHLPLTYTEFNSWHGAVIPTGADALRGLFTWGNARGMQGGYYYFRFNSERHPGIIDDAYNTHHRLNDALREAFADAEVEVIRAKSAGALMGVHNRRNFTLRDVVLEVTPGDGQTYRAALPDLAPGESAEAAVAFEREVAGKALLLEGAVTFTTHHAFQERVPFRLPVP